MKKFEINWSNLVREYYTAEIEAETEEEAKSMWENDPYGYAYDCCDTDGLSLDFESIEEITYKKDED